MDPKALFNRYDQIEWKDIYDSFIMYKFTYEILKQFFYSIDLFANTVLFLDVLLMIRNPFMQIQDRAKKYYMFLAIYVFS